MLRIGRSGSKVGAGRMRRGMRGRKVSGRTGFLKTGSTESGRNKVRGKRGSKVQRKRGSKVSGRKPGVHVWPNRNEFGKPTSIVDAEEIARWEARGWVNRYLV